MPTHPAHSMALRWDLARRYAQPLLGRICMNFGIILEWLVPWQLSRRSLSRCVHLGKQAADIHVTPACELQVKVSQPSHCSLFSHRFYLLKAVQQQQNWPFPLVMPSCACATSISTPTGLNWQLISTCTSTATVCHPALLHTWRLCYWSAMLMMRWAVSVGLKQDV